jgi:hypothetical protein
MHGTITTLRFPTAEAREAAVERLAPLVQEAATHDEVLVASVVEIGLDELVMFTAYADEAAAEAVSATLRPALAEAIGPLVSAPPERRTGRVVALAPDPGG